jgi:hypothetical protein
LEENAFGELSEENLSSIRSWDWSIMTENYRRLFRICLQDIRSAEIASEGY